MFTKLILVPILYTFFTASESYASNNWKDFFKDRMEIVGQEMEQDFSLTHILLNATFVQESQILTSTEFKNGHIFKLFNKYYILLNTELFNILSTKHMIISSQKQFTRVNANVSCVRAFDYKNKGFVAIAYYDEYIDIFGLSPRDQDFKYIQTINTKGYSVDMVFYSLNHSIFFFPAGTLNLERKFENDHASVYKWLGSHFDLASTSMFGSFGTNKILTFSDNGTSQFLISAEHVKSNKRLLLIVMEFFYQENNYYTIPRQVLLVNKLPLSIVTYVEAADRYVLYFQPDVTLVFLYDGKRLFKINSFSTPLDFQVAVASHVLNLPLIYVAQKANLLVYQPKNLKAEDMRLMVNVTFVDPFTSVTDMYVINDGSRNYVLLTGFDLDEKFVVTGISFDVEFYTEKRYPANSELLQCMKRLHNAFGEYDVNLREIKRNRKDKRSTKFNQTDPYVGDVFDDPYFLSKEHVELILSIEKLQQNIKKVQFLIDTLHETKQNQLDEKVINGTLKVNGNLEVDEVRAKNINIKYLNDVIWSPENWLSYTKPQKVTGAFSFKTLNAKQLQTSKESPFIDMLLLNGNQKITGTVSSASLNVQKIFTNKINNIPFSQIYLRKLPTTIKGRKQFDNVITDSIKTNQINQKNSSSVLANLVNSKSNLNFAKTVVIENLRVEKLNNIHWNTFKESVFKIGHTKVIKGNLKIENITTNQLHAKNLTGYKVDELFTITTDQKISSTFNFNHIHAANITAYKVNGIDIELEAAKTVDVMNEIKGPVSIGNMRVYGEMIVRHQNTLEILKNGDLNKHENSFLQLYHKKVKILGNVRIQNVDVLDTAKLLSNGTEFNSETLNNYWLKRTHQVIPNHVEALEGITTPHLTTQFLNNVKLSRYLLNNLEDKPPIKMYFENATILGNVYLNKSETHVPDLETLIEEAVKLNGSYNIRGNKTIKGRLDVKNLFTFSLNDIDPRNVVTTNTTNITGNYTFENLVINGQVNSNNTKFEAINNYDVKSILDNTVFVDENVDLEQLDFVNVTAKNVYLSTVNEESFEDYIEAVDDVFGLKLLENVSIFMDVKLSKVQNLSTINNIDVEDLKTKNIEHEKKSVVFRGPVRVKHFQAVYINNINFNDLSRNLFYRFWPQNVSGYHTFKYLYTRNLGTPQINDLRLSNIVNIRDSEPQHLRVSGLVMKQTKFMKSVYAKWMRCDIHQAAFNIKHPQTRIWNSIFVQQNATVWDESSSVYQILNNAVSTVKTNIITEPVIFNNICANSVTSTSHINDVDIGAIAKDALFLKGENQIVEGNKIFSELTAAGAYMAKNADIPVINKIIISKLNESIIYKKDLNSIVIKGTKTFYSDFQTSNLYSKKVSGINPEKLVSLDNLYMIPKAEFKHLKISNNFNINFINNIDFKDFLSKRILKNHSEPQELNGVYYFNTVQLNGESSLATINEVNLDDVIFDDGLQVINSSKQFVNDVKMLDNVKIGLINDYNISDLYERAVLFEENITISSSVQLHTISEVTANITTKSINGIQVADIKQMLNTSSPIIKANIINETIKKIVNLLTENLEEATKLPQQYLYLEKSSAFQIKLPKKIISAQAVNTKGHVIIHAIGEESADSCGLPKPCICPVQHTIHITPSHAVNYFPKSVSQKIYSYDDDEITVHIISNSLSSSQTCRNSSFQLNDRIEISWNRNVQNASKYTYNEIINGYISDVKYFSLDGYTYAVLSRSFDPLWNKTDLGCLLIVFSKEKDRIEDIKTINTRKASSLYIMQTAQGINLIVADSYDEDNIDTDIFRFNPIKQEFYLLRTIPSSGCKSVAGVVLGTDSLIILAQKRGTVQVLKYRADADNYYFYQSFKTDSPVISVSSFYLGNFGISDAYLSIVTETSQFYLYSFAYLEGWKLMARGELNGLQSFVPFVLKKQTYLFAPSEEPSNLLTVAKQG